MKCLELELARSFAASKPSTSIAAAFVAAAFTASASGTSFKFKLYKVI
jgi:hypothetical protein